DFAAAGVAPAEAGGSVAPPSDREALLARAADLAGQASTWLTNGSPVPGGTSAAGAQFRSLAAELGSAVAAAPPGGQPAVNDSLAALQLSMLVDAEALRKPAASDSARRLHLIAAALWATGRDLAGRGSGPGGAVPALSPSGLDPALLDAGGLFNGHPPALQPGDPPDKDVPGGIPSLNGVLTGGG